MERLNAYYCFFAALVNKEVKTYDEFLYAETDTAARAQFDISVRKRFGTSEVKQAQTTIRNLTRIVRALRSAEDTNVPATHDSRQAEDR